VTPFDLARLKEELKERNEELASPGFWDDIEKAQSVNRRIKTLERKIDEYESLVKGAEDVKTLILMAVEEKDESLSDEVRAELDALSERTENLRLSTLLKGEYDANNAILSLHAGAGGTEAADWTQMLYRMYSRYCDKNGFELRVLDVLEGDEAGLKSVTFEVNGENAYGYLKAEKGVHRLVRISPFDSNARRHTSFASLDVMPVIEDDTSVQILPEDLKVDTYRSSGAGGQHINKTESAIRITHVPTGIVVSCQTERSQIQNRETAMKMLRSKLIELKERERFEKQLEIKGELKKIEWGSQIRSYVFHPYSMAKDHRTGAETANVQAVMDGDIGMFINAYLSKI